MVCGGYKTGSRKREAPVVYFAVAYRKIPGHYVTAGALRRIPRGDIATVGKSINAPRTHICVSRAACIVLS